MLDFLLFIAVMYAISVLPVTVLIYRAIAVGDFTAENTPWAEWLLMVSPEALAFWFGLTWPYWLWCGRISKLEDGE